MSRFFVLKLEDAALAAASCQIIAPLELASPALEASAIPAIGTPMAIEVLLQQIPLEPGKWEAIHANASCLQDVAAKRPFLHCLYLYRLETVEIERERNGQIETIRYFGLGAGRRGWAYVFDDPDGLMASPPLAGDDTATIPCAICFVAARVASYPTIDGG